MGAKSTSHESRKWNETANELLKEGTISLHTYIHLVRLDYTRRIDDDDDDDRSSARLFVRSSGARVL